MAIEHDEREAHPAMASSLCPVFREMFALREGKPEAIGLPPVNEDHQE